MRVLVVDDSTLFRKVVRDALAQERDVEIVGSAPNGRAALEKIDQLAPDIVTLDLEMPEMDGLEVLRQLQGRPAAPSVIMISAFTDTGALQTTRALKLGAFDFVLKPTGARVDENLEELRAALVPKFRILAERKRGSSGQPPASAATNGRGISSNLPQRGLASTIATTAQPEIVAIGISTGGPAALAKMLPKLPGDLPVPIVIVQHMPPLFTRSMADDLNASCALHVLEAQGNERLQPGEVYIAPGGKQMKVIGTQTAAMTSITDDPPERSCKPAVDYLFRSLAQLYENKVLAIVMTGMGDDGTLGCRLLNRKGARIIAQDEASSTVYGMPRQVVEAGLADVICPLDQIHQVIVKSFANQHSTAQSSYVDIR